MNKSQRVHSIAITGEQLAEAIYLLKTLRMFLNGAIANAVLPGEKTPREEIDRENVAVDRRDYREAGKLLKLLCEARRE